MLDFTCVKYVSENLMLGQKLLLAEWDNENRTDKFTEGRINCLKSGVYTGAVPLGYDKEGKSTPVLPLRIS